LSFWNKPTAVQIPEPAPAHDTPLRPLESDELELGLGTTDQVVPLNVSTSVWVTDPLLKSPAAVHELVDTHETLERLSIPIGLSFGLGTKDQVVPFHISISVVR
jgi:hypothetical protein